jgi:hypothetical protein
MDTKSIDNNHDRPIRYNNEQNNKSTYGQICRSLTQAKIQDKTNDHAAQKRDKSKQQWFKKHSKRRTNTSTTITNMKVVITVPC